MNVSQKIDKLLEEAIFPYVAPAMIPLLQSDHAYGKVNKATNQEELNKFKKDYSNYQTYDRFPAEAGRGMLIGGAGGLGLAAVKDYNDTHPDLDNGALYSLIPALGAGIGVLGAGIDAGVKKLFKQESIKDAVFRKEKEFKG